jgi:hypothetical protein
MSSPQIPPDPPNPPFIRVDFAILKERLTIIADATKRARGAFLLCILASSAMFLCLWNTYGSWDRDFAFMDRKRDFAGMRIVKAATPKEAEDIFTQLQLGAKPDDAWKGHKKNPANENDILDNIKKDVPLFKPEGTLYDSDAIFRDAWIKHSGRLPTNLHQEQVRSWIDTQTVSVGLLGIKISVSDFAFLGSIALFLCNYYLLLCQRRENHDIGYLFQDIYASDDTESHKYAYHALSTINSLMVFNLTGPSSLGGGTDDPIDSLETPNRKLAFVARVPGIRKVTGALDFLPAATILTTILCDIGWSLPWRLLGDRFFVSPFRPSGELPFATFDTSEVVYFWGAEIFALAALTGLIFMSFRIRHYEKATRKLLDSVYKKLGQFGLEPKWISSFHLTMCFRRRTIKLRDNTKLLIKCDAGSGNGKIEIKVDGQAWRLRPTLAPGDSTEVIGRQVQLRLPKKQTHSSTGTYRYIGQEG